MSSTKKIKTALVSVFHKDGLEELLGKLHEEGVQFLSTGGTQQFIESLGYPCQKVEDVTTYPSILGGRVKTLHPKIFGGILIELFDTIPPNEITAISVVPPPISTIMLPSGALTSIPIPMAAAMGS